MSRPPRALVEDQSEVMEFLSRPESYGQPEATVTRIDTHGAAVFLVGERAFKLKHAVKFPYMDFSTRERRRAVCEAEVRINRRTAPAVYLGVRAVRRGEDGRLRLDGDGPVVDWLVEMVRFDEDTLFDRMARRGELTPSLMERLADVVAEFHDRAERRPEDGGAAAMGAIIDNNAEQFAALSSVLDEAGTARLTALSRAELARRSELLERRRAAGLVRHCHGDLHLRNICLVDGRPTLFDAIEFNQRLATIDVLYDFAFLLMDLWERGLEDLASVVFNRYLWRRPEDEGLALLPLFLSCRAAIRAHVSATMSEWQSEAAARRRQLEEAGDYLELALGFLKPEAPRMVAVGGLSGSGKSTLAGRLAAAVGRPPGAVVLRSDVIRKEIMGVDFAERLDESGYTAEVTERVYETLRQRAAGTLAAGQAVIVDAVHARAEERAAAEAVARAAGVPFAGLWLEAPAEVMAARLGARRGDASDATATVLERQLSFELGPVEWRRLDTAAAPGDGVEATLARARRLLGGGAEGDCGARD